MKHKIFMSLILVCVLSSSSFAEIDSAAVEAAWAKISKADGFKTIPITYEENDSPNAWVKFSSQENFSVHVTKGLMKILESEEEIAGVLGHEIGHVRLGHYDSGVNRAVGWALLSAVLGNTAGEVAQTVGNIGMNLAESGFSRGQEVEADDYGTELLKKAGYNPIGLYDAMSEFAKHKYVTEPNGFNSHPPTERRLQHLKEKAQAVQEGRDDTQKINEAQTRQNKTKKVNQTNWMK